MSSPVSSPLSTLVRSSRPVRPGRHHRLSVGVAVAVGASLTAGFTADGLATPIAEPTATAVALEEFPAETTLEEGAAVSSALAEVAALQTALERTAAASASRIHPDDPAVQALNVPADRAANPVSLDEEPAVDAADRSVAEPSPEPEAVPEPEAASEPEAAPTPATSTSGVSRATWEAVAGCESNNDWTIDTGNSFYGGLQFNLKSWNWAGGQRYAAYPHHATKDQQIAVADRLLEIHPAGWGAWPACSATLGLR